MNKKMFSVWSKRVLALALSAVLVTPVAVTNVAEAYDYSIEVPAPLMELDFEGGFKGESVQKNSEGKVVAENNGFEIVESEPVLNYECEETKVGDNGTIYEYDFETPLYEGTGLDTKYKKVSTANTPSTEYDELMGHVIWMHDDYTVPEFIKTEPAAYTNETTGEPLTDVNTVLDTAHPPYTPQYDENGVETAESLAAKEKATLQKEYTYYPEAKMNNPFADSDAEAVTINYWIKLTEDAANAGVSENTVVINIKKSGSLQYPSGVDKTTVWPVVQDSKVPYGFANGFLQISADGSVIFTEDDGATIDQNKNSETAGQVVAFNTENKLVTEGSDSVLSDICKPGEWHMVTVQISDAGITTYYDGKASEVQLTTTTGAAFNDAAKGSLLTDWLATADAVSIGGCNADYTKALGFDANVTPFMLDDLRFYGVALSAEQITELYNEGTAKMSDKAIPEPTVITFDSADVFSTDIKGNNPAKDKVEAPVLAKDTRMGSVLKTFASKTTESSGAKIANPFAGKDLTGATVSYWMKAESEEVSKKGEVSYTATIGLGFMDAPKELYHAKMQEATKYTKASTALYAMTDGFAVFSEGYTDVKVPETLKNQFARAVDAEDAAALIADNDGEWHLYTMVLTNKEVKYYVDGVKLENTSIDKAPRFFDGYYQRVQDALDDNELYGGSGNSGATALLTFLSYEDTDMYVAFANANKSASTYMACSDAYFGEIECYDAALTDEQVAEVYAKQTEKYPEITVKLGDVDQDENITATDALAVLKHAAKLQILEGDLLVAAEVTGEGTIDASDALEILKVAAKLRPEF